MKRVFIIFLIIVGIYIVFNAISNSSLLPFSKKGAEAGVTSNINKIEFDVSTVNMTIVPNHRDDVKAKLEGKGKVSVERNGDTIEVSFKRPWMSGGPFFGKSELTVFIPEDYDNDVYIDMAAGNLEFSGKSARTPMKLENLALDMSAGNVEFNNLSANHFKHDGSAGNLTINTLSTKEGTFDMSAGNVKIRNYSGALDVDMSAGKFDVQMDKLTGSIDMEMSAGSATIDLPKNASFQLDGKMSAGNISCDLPLDVQKQDKRNLRGTHGSGKYEIDIDMSSGNAKIK
jgi:lia operon protein LiaG